MKQIIIKAESIHEVNEKLSQLEKEYKYVEVIASATVNSKEVVRVKVYNSKPPFTY